MIYIKPNYFDDFKCIADKCKHSCCIGWEIDIDSDTEMFYSVLPGETGEKIRENISEDVPPHFMLKNNKCPFLNEKGLCDIILNFGEDAVCEICREHPRFYNEFENFTEVGLGLCCEEAGRIILNDDKPFTLIGEYKKLSKEEKEFLFERQKVFKILQNRKTSINERFVELATNYGLNLEDFTADFIKNAYLSLEMLDNNWSKVLNKININLKFENELHFEQFAVYLVYRHFKRAFKTKYYSKCIKFIISACVLLNSVSQNDFVELARMFSSEIEYSEENMLAILEKM